MQNTWRDPSTWRAALAECRARYPVQRTTIAGVNWSYLDTGGSDPALLLLPGAMGFADTSFHFVLAFAPQLRVLSVDYPAAISDGDRLVDGLVELLNCRTIEAAHVVGGSYSGLVAQRLADHHPARVRSLILANTWAADPRRARWFRPAAWCSAHMPAWLLQRITAACMDSFLPGSDQAVAFWRGYFADILPAFTPHLVASRLRTFARLDAANWQATPAPISVLLVESSGDTLFGAHSRRALRRRYPQAQRVWLACPGHAATLTHVNQYIQAYQQHIQQHTADAAPLG